ncbi:hypothetical protein CRC_01658 [Cylindrospermopsis raciborskii CS-505]|nr:hypothetical protein CRC_01658 [Cylindrospermopsis raciborskii CS-505]
MLENLIARFPLGSGINGNLYEIQPFVTICSLPASLWEVELMETREILCTFCFCLTDNARFPLGSGINGNVVVVGTTEVEEGSPLPSGKWN